jgi:hypothetical protein
MIARYIAIFLAAFVLAGCKTYEGSYALGCVAFEGNNVTLAAGRFTWEKFTDQVIVDDDGNVVDQFPDYPRHGSYRIELETLYLEPDAGASMQDMHLIQHDDQSYLLTAQQFETWEKTGKHDKCALMLGEDTGN